MLGNLIDFLWYRDDTLELGVRKENANRKYNRLTHLPISGLDPVIICPLTQKSQGDLGSTKIKGMGEATIEASNRIWTLSLIGAFIRKVN